MGAKTSRSRSGPLITSCVLDVHDDPATVERLMANVTVNDLLRNQAVMTAR